MNDETAWPDDEPTHRLRPPATTPTAGLDALAAVLDGTPRQPATVALGLTVGRRAELVGPRRIALESLSGHADVTVDDDHTSGTVPLTGTTFDDLAELFEELDYAVVEDTTGVAIADWREETLRFALPSETLASVEDAVGGDVADRIDRVD